MEPDPVEISLIVDGPGVGGPMPERLQVCLASPAKVIVVNERERDQLDRIDFDLAIAHPISAATFHLGAPPQSECDRNVTRQHGGPKFSAELHRLRLRRGETARSGMFHGKVEV